MHKTKTLKQDTKKSTAFLTLVTGLSSEYFEDNSGNGYQSVEPQTVRFLTWALMNRLRIPQSHSIVGLLDVGETKDNFDEIFKWVSEQVACSSNNCDASLIQELEQKFQTAVNRFPVM